MRPSTTALRWMWIWITVAVLVVIVVIGFLFSIADALESIDEGLDEAQTAVVSSEGDVKPLPEHIQDVNATLGRVENALEPIPEQADRIVGALASIRGELVEVDGTLVNTNDLLVSTASILTDTERSLNATETELVDTDDTLGATESRLDDTTGLLVDVDDTLENTESDLVDTRQLAARIQRELVLAQEFDSLGTNAIFKHVRFLNGGRGTGPDDGAVEGGTVNRNGLRFIEEDADGIRAGLLEVNKHLTSICRQIPLPPFEC